MNTRCGTRWLGCVAAVAAASTFAPPTSAQQGDGYLSTIPAEPLTAGLVCPGTEVSTMKMVSGDWVIKPLYAPGADGPHVTGLFVFAPSNTGTGSNLLAIWYQRPTDDCDPWTAKTWDGGKVWDAVAALKVEYGIPDIQDPYWEADPDTTGTSEEKPYSKGFSADDPIGNLVNVLPNRDAVVEALKAAGYSVANVPFEKGTCDVTTIWLSNAARLFEATLGRGLDGASLANGVGEVDGPPVRCDPDGIVGECEAIAIDICGRIVWYWICHCDPHDVYGDWIPDDQLCGCRTDGPFCAASGTIHFTVSGDIEISVPWGKIKLHGEAGATLNYCICAWHRVCSGSAHRTVTHIDADCNRTYTSEHAPLHYFEQWYWTQTSSESECHLSSRPAHCPPQSQDCDLTLP